MPTAPAHPLPTDDDRPAMVSDLRAEAARLDASIARVDARVDKVDAKVDKLDARFDRLEGHVDARFEKVDARFEEPEGRSEVFRAEILALFHQRDRRFMLLLLSTSIGTPSLLVALLRLSG